jgi:hypothetical protein
MERPISINQTQGAVTIRPNGTERIIFQGSYFSILSNNTMHDVIVSADSGLASPCKAGIGMPTMRLSADGTSLEPAVFHYLDFRNPSNNESMTIEYLIVLGTADDTRSVISGYLQMDLSAPALETAAALTVQEHAFSVLPASVLVKERIVQNNGDYPIWWGDEHTDPANKRGLVLLAGGSAVINCHGSVYFKAQDGASTLSVINVLKSS